MRGQVSATAASQNRRKSARAQRVVGVAGQPPRVVAIRHRRPLSSDLDSRVSVSPPREEHHVRAHRAVHPARCGWRGSSRRRSPPGSTLTRARAGTSGPTATLFGVADRGRVASSTPTAGGSSRRGSKDPTVGEPHVQRARRDGRHQAVVPRRVRAPPPAWSPSTASTSGTAAAAPGCRTTSRAPTASPSCSRGSTTAGATGRTAEAPWLATCTVLTTTPGPDLDGIHDRMPVVLERDALRPVAHRAATTSSTRSTRCARPRPRGTLVHHPVDARWATSATTTPSSSTAVSPITGSLF